MIVSQKTEVRRFGLVMGNPIDALSAGEAETRIHEWAKVKASRYVCIANVHVVATGSGDEDFGRVLAHSDLNTPDGAPVAWTLRRAGYMGQQRVDGPDLMWRYLALAEKAQEPIFLLGSTEQTLALLCARIRSEFPNLIIAGSESPPFRPLTAEEDAELVERINRSGARTLWVGLGCPKQERWMHDHKGRVDAVMLGVGAAFDYHAGTLKRAPAGMRKIGLEWLYRLSQEPRRLWRRYTTTNAGFISYALRRTLLTQALSENDIGVLWQGAMRRLDDGACSADSIQVYAKSGSSRTLVSLIAFIRSTLSQDTFRINVTVSRRRELAFKRMIASEGLGNRVDVTSTEAREISAQVGLCLCLDTLTAAVRTKRC